MYHCNVIKLEAKYWFKDHYLFKVLFLIYFTIARLKWQYYLLKFFFKSIFYIFSKSLQGPPAPPLDPRGVKKPIFRGPGPIFSLFLGVPGVDQAPINPKSTHQPPLRTGLIY